MDLSQKISLTIFSSLVIYFIGFLMKGCRMESVYIVAIICATVLLSIIFIGGGMFISEFRKENGYAGLSSAKCKAQADVLVNETQLKIAARNEGVVTVEREQ